jgi:antitoxin (DNA-binding transcriptional repressor) of toxin-antitoxin stability system
MFVLKKTHEARIARILAIQSEERTKWRKEMQAEREAIGRLIKDKGRLLAELAPLKARALAQEEGRRRATAASAAKRAAAKADREAIPY